MNIYVNLTSGLEWVREASPFFPVKFVRFQSSHAEAKCWEEVLSAIPDDMLFNLALGNECVVLDASANKKNSRAIYQIVPLIRFILTWRWYRTVHMEENYVKSHNATEYFTEISKKLSVRLCKKIDYYKKFLNGRSHVKLIGKTIPTKKDGDYKYWKELAVQKIAEVGYADKVYH